ncbi:hypothetical protein B9Z55_007417 [Caenorhabditis nigoni]|uniref:Uncharacterized protein n=1 Tax=Caenorhabditis nigoni TaxID=1611254 RepID=A0A2G5V9Q9_9PELO|nr:hypothetical protein B9Z55_007417 [Caenorhabditis nigoni]
MSNQNGNLPNAQARRLPPIQRVVPTPQRPTINRIHPNRVWPTLQAEYWKNPELENENQQLRNDCRNSQIAASNATEQLEEAEKRNRKLQQELDRWRSGVFKLACHCDGVDVDVSEGSMDEQEHVEVPFNIFDRDIAAMDAQSDNYWDDQIDQFLGHEEGFASQNGSATNPPAYANFQEAANVARVKFPTPNIPECNDLSVYLFDENGKGELPQLKKPLISAYNFYRKQSVNSRHVEWKHLSKEEMEVWNLRFNQVRMVQVKQCRANLIAYEPSVNQKRKLKKLVGRT